MGADDLGEEDLNITRQCNSTNNIALLNSLRHTPPMRLKNGHPKEKLLSDSSFEMDAPDIESGRYHDFCRDCMHEKSFDDFYHVQNRSEMQPFNSRSSGRRSLPQLGQTYCRRKYLPPTPKQRRNFSGSWTSKSQFYSPKESSSSTDIWKRNDCSYEDVKNMHGTKPVETGQNQPEYSISGFPDKIQPGAYSDKLYPHNEYAISRLQHNEGNHLSYSFEDRRLPHFNADPKIYPPIRKYPPRRILPDISAAMKRRFHPEKSEDFNRSDSYDMRDLSKSEFHCEYPYRSNDTVHENQSDSEYSDVEEEQRRDQYQSRYLIKKNSLPKPKYRSSIDKHQAGGERLSDSPANGSPLEYESEDNRHELRLERSRSRLPSEDRFQFRNIRSPISSPEDTASLIKYGENYQKISSYNGQPDPQEFLRNRNAHRNHNNIHSKSAFADTWA